MSKTVGAFRFGSGNRRVHCAGAAAKSMRDVPEAEPVLGYA
jgi:hypothetical protein